MALDGAAISTNWPPISRWPNVGLAARPQDCGALTGRVNLWAACWAFNDETPVSLDRCVLLQGAPPLIDYRPIFQRTRHLVAVDDVMFQSRLTLNWQSGDNLSTKGSAPDNTFQRRRSDGTARPLSFPKCCPPLVDGFFIRAGGGTHLLRQTTSSTWPLGKAQKPAPRPSAAWAAFCCRQVRTALPSGRPVANPSEIIRNKHTKWFHSLVVQVWRFKLCNRPSTSNSSCRTTFQTIQRSSWWKCGDLD